MLKRIGNDDAYVDPDMIAMIAPREGGGVRIFMKQEGGGAVINLTEGTVREAYEYLFPEEPVVQLDPEPFTFQGRRYRMIDSFGDRRFAPRAEYSQIWGDYRGQES